jgi:hypothetical protein
MRIPRPGRFLLSIAALALGGVLTAAPSAMAQPVGQFVYINFALQDGSPDCPNSNLCHFDFSLPEGIFLRQVACRNALLSTTATQTATLTLTPGTAVSRDIPLVPVKVTGNSFTVSQRIVAVAFNTVRVTIQSFGAAIVAGASCSIAGSASGGYNSPTPFSADDVAAECNADRTVCTFEFGPVPTGHRWVLDQVACRNNLLSSTATEIVTLSTITAGGQQVAGFPLIPEKLTGNGFTVSQRVAIPAAADHKVRIRIQSFGAGIVASPFCTLSATSVEPFPA